MNRFRLLVALFAATLFLPLAACQNLDEDLANAPDDEAIGRYGLETIKLDDERTKVLEALTKDDGLSLSCQQHSAALHSMKRKFMVQDCKLIPVAQAAVSGAKPKPELWGEQLERLNLRFVEQKLAKIELVFSIDDRYEKLYEQHAKRLFGMLGKPDVVNMDNVIWEANTDRAILREASKGKVHLLIQNKAINDQFLKTKMLMQK